MGTQIEQAKTLVCSYDEAKIYMLDVDLTGFRTLNVESAIDWVLLIFAAMPSKLDYPRNG
jgi:hypothetical protein